MTSLVTKYISKRFLGESLQNNFGKEDPYFETVPATRLNGRPSKKKAKKRRKALPAGLSEHDGKVLTKVKRRAYYLDMSLFNCCGIRFGWSSVIAIIPVVGDSLDAFMALMVMRSCQQVQGGLPSDVKMRMYLNIVLDFVLGLVPIIGDLTDAVFRANTRNAVLLEKYLRQKGEKALRSQGHTAPVADPSDPEVFDQQLVDEDGSPPPRQGRPSPQGTTDPRQRPTQPTEARAPERPQRGSGWFGGGRKTRQQDIEAGGELQTREPSGNAATAHPPG